MGNQWFRFKQFEIQQDQCAMKVGTDGVILGAWADVSKSCRALDVGTGTGLLALMLAQRNPGLQIDAIEIERNSAQQAASNCRRSKFADRITVYNTSFSEFCKDQPGNTYDLIICNPPFFSDSYRASGEARSLARHDDTLTITEILEGSGKLLKETGVISLILPAETAEAAITHATEFGLYPGRELQVKPTLLKDVKRTCIEFGYCISARASEMLVIEEAGRHRYSEAYRSLTKEFYLEV